MYNIWLGKAVGQRRYILRYAYAPILNRRLCNSTYSYNGQITSNMLCAGYMQGYTDACYDDSGGPLSCHSRSDSVLSRYSNRWHLAGVVSGGRGCGQRYYPSIYANMTAAPICRWLSTILENN
ncbi:Transmembrane protease serine 11B [Trichoplax sp. H2]|nr:Transmembrane protease serine 11B [Trichoplax sp. H2]|eukprot:RDD43406.1 Transmembrane protease serine 11B [Trichoplax sp. H2]